MYSHISDTAKVKFFSISRRSDSDLAPPSREIAPFIAGSLMDGEQRGAELKFQTLCIIKGISKVHLQRMLLRL